MIDQQAKRTRLDYLNIALANVAVPATLIWQYQATGLSEPAMLISSLASTVLVNGALLGGIFLRNKRRDQTIPRSVVVCCLAFALASAGAAFVGLRLIPSGESDTKLVFSNTTLGDIYPEERRLFIELLRRKEQISQEYRHEHTNPIAPPLYSPESFADRTVIQATSAALKTASDADFAYFERQEKADVEFKNRMSRVNPRSGYLDVVNSRSEKFRLLGSLLREWVDSVISLYAFAAGKSNAWTVSNGKVFFSSSAVQAEFLKQLQASQAAGRAFQGRFQSLTESQQKARHAAGLAK